MASPSRSDLFAVFDVYGTLLDVGTAVRRHADRVGAAAALAALELEPLLDLDLRLGEGTGALLALPLVRAAAAVLNDMGTIAELTNPERAETEAST